MGLVPIKEVIMTLVNGINPALTRPCSYCKKHIFWSDTIYRSKRYWGQLHKDCLDKYDAYKEAENALMGKEDSNVPMGKTHETKEVAT